MNKVRITAIRQTVYEDLMAKYENPIEHTCDVREGQQWISADGECPEGMCPAAWYSMREFVASLARGEGNFYDGWMKNPMSAMISCNAIRKARAACTAMCSGAMRSLRRTPMS